MKSSDLKVVAIILSIALFFTIITSNAVSIASVVILAKGGSGATVQTGTDGTQQNTVTDNSANTNNSYVDNSANTNTNTSTDTNANANTNTNANNNANANTNTNTNNNANANTNNNANANTNNNANANNNTQKPADTADKNAWSKEQTFNFYKKSAHDIATNGTAGYNKIEFQELPELNMGSAGTVLKPIIDSFMTPEADAEVQVQAKGSDDAKNRFPDCTLTDLSKVASATKKDLPNGNYEITIIMMDEDTPMNEESSFLAQVTSSVLFWEGIQETIDGISVIKAVNSRSVLYNDYKIVAEMTKDGKFVSLGHFATVDINANAKISLIGDIALSGKLLNTCKYSDFKY